MSDELDEFTAQLNSAGNDKAQPVAKGAPGAPAAGAPPNMTPQ